MTDKCHKKIFKCSSKVRNDIREFQCEVLNPIRYGLSSRREIIAAQYFELAPPFQSCFQQAVHRQPP